MAALTAVRHLLAVSTRGPTPKAWMCDARSAVSVLSLVGDFHWTLSRVRRCVGNYDAGRHVPCPTREPVSVHARCQACSGLEDVECVFEPRCQDEALACRCTFGPEPHVVYVAFHGTLPKVGMTLQRRVAERLREQGADAWFLVGTTADRGAARRLERQVSFLHGLPEYRSHRESLPQLARPVPWDTMAARAGDWARRLAAGFPVVPTLHRITDHPVEQPIGGVPRRVKSAGTHAGKWLGAKGNHLLYREARRSDRLAVGGAIIALKASDLVGRELERADDVAPSSD